MCGIAGMVGKSDVGYDLYDALTLLQHRGQDAAGMVTCDGDRLNLRKHNGLVRDVFRQQHMDMLKGNMGIAHVRYPTAGTSSSAEAQPMYVNSPFGICLAHNGNLTNAEELNEDLFRADRRHINTNSDSEVLLNVFAHELQAVSSLRTSPDEIFEAVQRLHQRAVGAYAAVALITGYGILGFRDAHGIRPLVYGKRSTPNGDEYMMASESVVLSVLGFEVIADVAPGEAVYIESNGQVHKRQCAPKKDYSPCIFEYVYLARPDSVIDSVSVYKARLKMGEKLADKIKATYPDNDIDVVIPIPDTSCTAALPMAHRLGVKYREGFVKNRYIGRTFIMPGQAERKKSVRRKLSPIELEFKGKNVLLVDDSIVRGTTSKQIVQMAREAGASRVYLASAAPPVRYPNVYGIDMPAASEFVAHNLSVDEIADYIGADWLLYQDLQDLKECASGINDEIDRFDCSIFDGDYVTGDVDEEYLNRIEMLRNDSAKSLDPRNAEVIELHNQG
ncbi:MAG: amidophosphoribosyltransferase [Pseudomonadales bacterium]|nr:amidophosphoribosyltransferase [Pseudomonadales bacterium]MBO6595043.1 amidophosphoribosyltransferase [Pseudomonadales bacterium]MBO6657982.1 amidophosphoribosyltransferase [Pseudomonadales bacterium]MBO6821398.1 amidophosphoribosyltransferase [Pseudomonadales bacterium]